MVHTTTFERALHLLLFVSGGLAVAVIGLAVFERIGEVGSRAIRPVHIGVAAGAFAALFAAERVYHFLH